MWFIRKFFSSCQLKNICVISGPIGFELVLFKGQLYTQKLYSGKDNMLRELKKFLATGTQRLYHVVRVATLRVSSLSWEFWRRGMGKVFLVILNQSHIA